MGAWDSELLEETRPATPPPISWPLLETLPARLAAGREPAAWRELLRSAHEELKARFLASEPVRSEEHTSELQSPDDLVFRLLLEKKNKLEYLLHVDSVLHLIPLLRTCA